MMCGQTNTGKTYTMFGSLEQPGIAVNAVRELFKSEGAAGRSIEIEVSSRPHRTAIGAVRAQLPCSAYHSRTVSLLGSLTHD